MGDIAGRLGVLGGTFDPIHIGHLILAQEARWQLDLESVLFVPAGLPWRKANREITPFEHRAAMVQLAIEGLPWAELCTLEGKRPGPSYTAQTLQELEASNAGAELVLILGEDALLDLPNWKDVDQIKALALLAVAQRLNDLAARETDDILPVEMPRIDVSSSELRQRMMRGQPVDFFLPPAVAHYIREKNLYQP